MGLRWEPGRAGGGRRVRGRGAGPSGGNGVPGRPGDFSAGGAGEARPSPLQEAPGVGDSQPLLTSCASHHRSSSAFTFRRGVAEAGPEMRTEGGQCPPREASPGAPEHFCAFEGPPRCPGMMVSGPMGGFGGPLLPRLALFTALKSQTSLTQPRSLLDRREDGSRLSPQPASFTVYDPVARSIFSHLSSRAFCLFFVFFSTVLTPGAVVHV